MNNRNMGRIFAAKLLLVGLVVAGIAGPAHAHADVSAACWQHLTEVKTSNTSPAADRRYHLSKGEPSPCTEFDASQDSSYNTEQRRDEPRQDNNRRHRDSFGFGCKLTWRGVKCG